MIVLTDVSKSYNKHKIFEKFSLRIDHGDFIGIIGPSGSGKTTLLSILATLDKADSGEVLFDDYKLHLLEDDKLAQIRNQFFGFIFQSANMLMHLDVLENILLPFAYSKKSTKQAITQRAYVLLKQIGLEGFEHKRINTLSGGEQQRIAIARALILDPQVIFADEPTGNLDAENSSIVLNILQSLTTEYDKTVIMVTHDPYAMKYCSRTILLEK